VVKSRAVIAAPALLACALSAAAPTLAVLDLNTHQGVSADLARTLSELLVVEVRGAAPGVRVFGSADVASLIHFQEQKVRLGQRCEDSNCLAEIGGALGAKEMVTGSLSVLGSDYLLVLRRVDVAHAKVLSESSGAAPVADATRLRELVRTAVHALFAPVGEAVASENPHRSRLWPWILGGAAVVTLGVCIGGWVPVANFNSLRNQSQTEPVTYAQAKAAQPGAATGQVVGIVAAIATAGLGAGAVLTW
jgi:hypothetical protein